MNIKNSVLVYIIYKQLNWHGYVQRMNEESLLRKILEWCPPGRRREGRPQNSSMQEVRTGMREKGINNMEWIDTAMEKENKTLDTEIQYVQTSVHCT